MDQIVRFESKYYNSRNKYWLSLLVLFVVLTVFFFFYNDLVPARKEISFFPRLILFAITFVFVLVYMLTKGSIYLIEVNRDNKRIKIIYRKRGIEKEVESHISNFFLKKDYVRYKLGGKKYLFLYFSFGNGIQLKLSEMESSFTLLEMQKIEQTIISLIKK